MTSATLIRSMKDGLPTTRYQPGALAACLLLLVSVPVSADEGGTQRVEIDALIKAGELDQAAERLQAIDDSIPEGQDLTLQLARLARALQQEDRADQAAQFFQRAVAASRRPAAKTLAAEKITLVHLAAGSALIQAGLSARAVECLAQPFGPNSEATEPQKQYAIKLCLQLGAKALAEKQTETASAAYSLVVDSADDDERATAMLGIAWAAAIAGTDPGDAASKLSDFVDAFPQHSDAPQALRACAECLQQAGRSDDAQLIVADLLERWPDSDASAAILKSHMDQPVSEVPKPVQDWLMAKATANQLEELDVRATVLGLLVAAQRDEIEAWNHLTRRLSAVDRTGQGTSDGLQQLVDASLMADAQRLATSLLSWKSGDQQADQIVAPREAACRWAARNQLWSMLALAAENESIESGSEARTATIERLLAEALMQTGRASDAHLWWQHLVDVRESTDFATLLRCAETSTAIEEIDIASKRIEAARAAAEQNKFRVSLVDMLAAELSIRRLRFDEARSLLENVVRADETDRGLRGRAQWLIGETFYLQQEFSDAIEAYRRVEGIDPGGAWVAASLIQAGKAFEQLGRTREAAVCYAGLVSRFADSQHTQLARRRLATIAPDSPSDHPTAPNQTMRR